MARIASFVLSFVLIVFTTPVGASHPSVETWSTTIDSEDTTDCLTVTPLDGPQSLVDVDNQCMETFTLDSVTCSAVDCMLQSELQVDPEGTRLVSSFDIGLFGNELQAGDEVDVELGWSLGTAESGTVALTLTYEGYTGGEHDIDGTPTGTDGSKGDPGCGGCSSADAGPSALAAFLVLLGLAIRRRTDRA